MGGVTEAQGGGLRGGAGRNHAPLRWLLTVALWFFFLFFWLEMTFLRCRSNSVCGGRFINCCFEGLRSRSVLVVYLRFRMGGYFCFLVDKNVLPIPLSTEVAKS